jgi:cell division protein FtsW
MKNVLKIFGGDRVIWVLVFILTIYSVLAISSTVSSLSYREGNSVASYIFEHSFYLLLGWCIIYLVHLIPYRFYGIFAQLMVIIAVGLLAYTLKFGKEINDTYRWLEIGPIHFQTSDFAKFALIIFVARYLSRNQNNITDFKRGFLPVLFWIVLICGLIQPANLSTAAMLFMVCIILLLIGRVRTRYIAALIGVGLVLGIAYFLIFKNSEDVGRTITWEKRIERYFNPDPEENLQPTLAKVAISNGGLFGKFAGHSTQKHSLPHAYSDYIFAIIIEEYGFLFGALPLVFVYLILLYRAGVIVRRSERTFPAFLAIGLTLGIVLQAMIHMGVAVGLLPVTGQPLPFISRGGTSIMFTAAAFGIILGISRDLEEKEKEENG